LAGQVKLFLTPSTSIKSWQECQRIQIEIGTLSASSGRLCGLVVRVPGYRSKISITGATRFSLGQGPHSSVSTIEQLLGRKSSGSGVEKQRLRPEGIRHADYAAPFYPQRLALTSPTKRRFLGRYTLLTD
jgi:hypothetical protein